MGYQQSSHPWGILQANSGSPVISVSSLIGLAELSPGFALIDDKLTQGVVVLSPESIIRFLDDAGYAVDKSK